MLKARVAAFLGCMLIAVSAARSQSSAPRDPGQLTGRVVDETGAPIAGAAVAPLTGRFFDTAALLARPKTVTAADGTYAVTPGGSLTVPYLVIAATGRQSCAVQVVDPANNRQIGETVLMPGTRLLGRIRNESGAPLAGARLRVVSSIADRYGDRVRLLAGALSDAKGIFAVPGVPRTGLRLIAEADGYLTTSRLVAHDSPADLSLQKVGMVRGKVVDAAGAPVSGVTINPVTVESYDQAGSVSAADGTFALTVPSRGRFRLTGYQQSSPRQFSSGILHGAADDVVMAPVDTTAGAQPIEVRVVDAATREALPRYWLSQQTISPANLQAMMFNHGLMRKPYQGNATIDPQRQSGQPLVIVVDAPLHAFEAVPVPDDLDHPLEVALGPEAVLVGKVTDAATGKPVAGVAVRALPKGNSSGNGGRAEDAGPLSDADGNYRVGSLRAGEYVVQTHAPDRPNSEVFTATLVTGTETKLALTIPQERWLEFDLVGQLPPGPAVRISLGSTLGSGFGVGSFQHACPVPAALSLTGPGRFKMGPVGDPGYELQLFIPSRTRIGTGTTILLGQVHANVPATKITLPDLTMHVLQGRIELAQDVPSERIAVLAMASATDRSRPWWTARPTLAGVGTDGRFTVDLPVGTYCLQLADLLTGIVFHTEEQDLAVNGDTAPITIKPAFHWLELECRSQQPGEEAVVRSFGVTLPRPRNGACGAFLEMNSRNGNVDRGSVQLRDDANDQRWLVPEGKIEIKAWRCFDLLRPGMQSYQSTEAGAGEVDVARTVERLVLEVPPAPSDEELLRKH